MFDEAPRTRDEMAGLLIQLRDLAQNYDESDVARILGGFSLLSVDEHREAFREQVQEIRSRIEALLRVTAVWTYSEHMVFRRIQERSWMFVENLCFSSEYEDGDEEFLKLAEKYRQSLIQCIDKTLHYTDNLTKMLPNAAVQLVLD
jgi:hypothetical protein